MLGLFLMVMFGVATSGCAMVLAACFWRIIDWIMDD